MSTPRTVSEWIGKTYTILSDQLSVTDFASGDEITISSASGGIEISTVTCPGSPTHSSVHTGTDWTGVIYAHGGNPDTEVLVNGTTRHTSPIKVMVKSVFRDSKHRLRCTQRTEGPGGGVCWIAQDG